MEIKDLEGLTREELVEGLCNISVERVKTESHLKRLENLREGLDNEYYAEMAEKYNKLINNLTRESRVYLDAISYKN